MVEHKVGEVFETLVNGKTVKLKTVEDVGDELCENCIFDIDGACCVCNVCSNRGRKDKKSVHFEEVE